MATKQEQRSLWKRLTEKVKTLRPIEPGSYEARELSMDTQRENALTWLSRQPHKERNNIEFGSEIPEHLLKDITFATQFNERFGEKLADRVLPLEVRRSTEYQASTAESYQFLNAALQHDERSLQLEVKDHDKNFNQEDRQHAVDTVRRMGSAEALQFVADRNSTYWVMESSADGLQFFASLEHAADTNAAQRHALNALSNSVLGDKEFLLGLDKLGVELKNLPQHVKQSDALMRECLEEAPAFFEVASTTVRAEQASFDQAMKNMDSHPEQAAANYSAADKRLRERPENFLSAHKASMGGISPKDVPDSIRNNKDVIEELLQQSPDGLRFASRELRRDKQFITDMTEKYKIDVSRDTLIKDREVALNLTRTDSVRLDQLPESLQADREFVLNVVRLNGEQLKYASDEMRDDFEVALMAAQQGKLEGCSDRLRNDPYLVSKALEADPYSIVFASADIRDNEAFGLLAVRAKPNTVAVLSERLRNSVDIAQAVVETDPSCTEFLGQETRAKLIANLGQADREAYEYALTEGDHFAASRAMSKGFEGMRATQEREDLQAKIEQYQQVQVSGQIVPDGMPQVKREVESHDSKLTSKIGSFRTISPEDAATAMAAVPAATQAPATAAKTKQKMKI